MSGPDQHGYVPRQPYQLGLPGTECVLLAPASRLSSLVHYHWVLTITRERVSLPVIPDNAVDLVLCPQAPDYAELYLPVDERIVITVDGPTRYVGSSLRIDGLDRAFGRSLASLRQLAPGLETRDALGLGASIDRLRDEAIEPATIAATLDAFFLEHESRGTAPGDARPDPSLFELFLDTPESERISDTAGRAGLSERQFRREVRRLFGLGPKKLQRVVRLQRALGELIDGTPPRADFHDDSHRIRELGALTGWTPGEIRRMAENYNTARRHPSRIRPGDTEPEQ